MDGHRSSPWIRWAVAAALAAAAAPGAPRAAEPGGDARAVADAIAADLRRAGLEVKAAADGLVVSSGGAELARLRVRDEGKPGDRPGSAHLHVVSFIAAGPRQGLDACLYGLGSGRDEALRAVASAFTDRAFPPIRATVREDASTTALRFGGTEPWAVPGFRGLVGPFSVRSADVSQAEIDEALAQAPIFAGLRTGELPADGRAHLVKVVLLASKGAWTRSLEVDGKGTSVNEERWTGARAPSGLVMAVRFAVYRDRDAAERGEARRAALARLAAREPWLFTGEACPTKVLPPRLFTPPFDEPACAGGRLRACLDECQAGSGPSCYAAATDVERQEQDDPPADALYLRACRLGVASGCTNAAAMIARYEQQKKPFFLPAAPECAWLAFDVVCERSADPWACTMLGTGLLQGLHLARDPVRARDVLARACRLDDTDPACLTARRMLAELDAADARKGKPRP